MPIPANRRKTKYSGTSAMVQKSLGENLKSAGIRILVSVEKKLFERYQDQIHFHSWQPEGWKFYLLQELDLNEESSYSDLVTRIKNQRNQGFWGDIDNEDEFFNKMDQWVKRYKNLFIDFVTNDLPKTELPIEKNSSDPKEIDRLPEGESQIAWYMVLLLSMLQKVTIGVFDKVISRFISSLSVDTLIQEDTTYEWEQSNMKRVSVSLESIWKKKQSKLLSLVGIELKAYEGKLRLLSFRRQAWGIELQEYIYSKDPYLVTKFFERFLGSGVLLDRRFPKAIYQNLADIFLEMALFNPDEFCPGILDYFYSVWTNRKGSQEGLPQVDENVTLELNANAVTYRISVAINSFVKHEGLKEYADQFCERLIRERAFDLLLNQCKRLSSIRSFDSVFWLRKMAYAINEVNSKLEQEIEKEYVEHFVRSNDPDEFGKLIDGVHQILQVNLVGIEFLMPGHKVDFAAFFIMLDTHFHRLKASDFGKHPTPYIPFQGLITNSGRFHKEKLEKFSEILMAPQIELGILRIFALPEDFQTSVPTYIKLLSILLVRFFLLLHGTEENPEKIQRERTKAFFESLSEKASNELRILIHKAWYEEFLRNKSYMEDAEESQRPHLLSEQNALKSLAQTYFPKKKRKK